MVYGALLAVGLVLFLLSLVLRVRTKGLCEVKTVDLALVFIPLLIGLLITGKIQKFSVGGVDIETAQAFVGASKQPIKGQVVSAVPATIDDVVSIAMESSGKGPVDRIPQLIETKIESLEFYMGHGGYWGPAIEKYFTSLGAYNFLKYIVIYDNSKKLFAVYKARAIIEHFDKLFDDEYDKLANALNYPSDEAAVYLSSLPGFISGRYAIKIKSDKRFTLKKMEKTGLDDLPVIDDNGKFIGIISRNRIISSLIVDVTEQLDKITEGVF